ncbi:MAG TPA: NAD(P)(+) transhydrogenase (Re/Si-specific) subunit beta, partial [Phycisphaerales bacterium]|nr:NAD(P)(+) transhydrogenase (Re/Si-specific) subunit beta [Phycisphaerales bacterium]
MTDAQIQSLSTVAYVAAGVLFILSLGGLSNQETARRGNLYGIVGMVVALLATVALAASRDGFGVLSGTVLAVSLVGGCAIGAVLARRVQMTSMP